MPLPTSQHGVPDPAAAPAAPPATGDQPDTTALEAEVTRLRAALDQAAPTLEAVGEMKKNMAVAFKASRAHAEIANAVIRGHALPPLPAAAGTELPDNPLPEDLDDRDQKLIAAVREQTVKALTDQWAGEMAPVKHELETLRLRETARSLKDTAYHERIAARQADLTGLLSEDPDALRDLDGAFRRMDYPALFAENTKLREQVAASEGTNAAEANRRAGIAKIGGGGGRGAAGTSPEVNFKERYKDVPQRDRMTVIMDDVWAENG